MHLSSAAWTTAAALRRIHRRDEPPTPMRLIQGYLFRQLLAPALASTAALSAVALLSQMLTTLDLVVDQHQSPLVLAKIVALTFPGMLAMVMPIAVFVAALVALNRLHLDQEIVVCYAGGVSRWRVASAAFRLAALAAVGTLVLNLWVTPWAARRMRDELLAVKTDLVGSLVRDGAFTQPANGLTVYAQSTERSGLIHNLFIYEEKASGASTTFLAKRGYVVTHAGAPALVMRDGSNQEFSPRGVLNYLAFREYVLDLSPYLKSDEAVHYKISDRYLHELVRPDKTQEWERRNRKKMLAEAHARLAGPLYNVALMALALNAVLGGGFSRLGYGRRIATASVIAAVIRILGFGAQAACDASPALNVLQYAIPLGAVWWACRALFPPRKGAVSMTPIARKLAPLTPLAPA